MIIFFLANLDDPSVGIVHRCSVVRFPILVEERGNAILARVDPPWELGMLAPECADEVELAQYVLIEEADDIWEGLAAPDTTYWPKPCNVASLRATVDTEQLFVPATQLGKEWRDAVYLEETLKRP
jgi:hypothetical protein